MITLLTAKRRGNALRLPIEIPSWEFYGLIKDIYDDIAGELELTTQYEMNSILRGEDQIDYAFRRALIESVAGGSHVFISEGTLTRVIVEAQLGHARRTIRRPTPF